MAPEKVEVDDFGLPIRSWVPPPAEEKSEQFTGAAASMESHDTATSKNNGGADENSGARSIEKKSTDEKADSGRSDVRSSQEAPAEAEADTDADAGKATGDDKVDSDPATDNNDAPDPGATRAAEAEKTEGDAIAADVRIGNEPSEQVAEKTTRAGDGSTANTNLGHARGASTASGGVGEFSHHLATNKAEPQDKGDDDADWQEMPSYAPYDIYDDNDKLVAKEHATEEDEQYGYGNLGGAGKGYTRVDVDEDAESATSMDDNTKYLFKNGGARGTNLAEEDDEEQRDAVSQMQATKDLLTEGQRIAYVGLTRLEIFQLVKEVETLEKTKGSKKEVAMGAEATKMWGQKMMIRVYVHMDISEAEQIMVEQLSDHGVMPSDLTPLLMANARVKNPMAQEERKSTSASVVSPTDSARNSTTLRSPSMGSLPPASPVTPLRDEDEERPAEPPPPYEAHPEGDMPEVKTPSQLPTSQNLEIDLRWTVLCDLFLILIADSTYDARSRLLLERVGKSLEIDWLEIRKFEKRVTDALEMQQEADKENWNENEHMETRRKAALKRRYAMMGLATVGGGLVIGLSAGLLAPLIGAGLAAGFTTIGVTGTGAFLGGAGGAAIITTAAASSGGVVGVRAANRRTGAVKTFEYRPLHNNKRVNLIVSVSGWMTGKVDDVRLPFSTVDPIMGDLYSVLWEPEMLRSTGDTINILATEALTSGLQQVLGNTILMGLMAALQLPIILTKLAYLIDNPWAVSLDRATSAGKILADSLIDRNLGTRPVTLVGFSIGARVIFSCLQELSRRGAYGLVQNVYMFGSPVVVKKDEYLKARSVVPGRFVNGYNRNDWILGYLFRLTNGGIQRVAGLAPVEGLPWLENMDVTDLVKGHMEYRKMMPRLLRECGWLVESDEFTEIEDPDPENHSQRQRELINEIEEARKELEKEGQKKKSGRFSLFGRKKQLEKAEWEIYEEKNKEGGAGGGGGGGTRGEGGDGENGGGEGGNEGVLFDVEAIRAELAKDQMEIKELQSTLPPMKLDLSSDGSANPRDGLRNSKSADVVPRRDMSAIAEEPSPAGSTSRKRDASSYYAAPDPHEWNDEGEVSMTFEDSFHESPARGGSKPPPPPPKEWEDEYTNADNKNADDRETRPRPEMKSAQTVPNMTLRDPWNDPDDEDFGKEKEMTMTFA